MRWLFRALGALLVFALLGLGLLALIPSERVAQAAAREFQRLTGRELVIEGDVSPRLWPVLGVTTGPVRIANADWSTEEGPMFSAQSLVIEVNAAALLGGDVQILGLSATAPTLLLERGKDGRENWVFGGGGTGGEIGPDTPGAGRPFTLKEGTISGGTIRFVDRKAGQDLTLDGVDLTLHIPDHAGPFTLAASAVARGRPVGLDLKADVFSGFAEGRIVPLTANLSVGKSTLSFQGRGGWSPMALDGRLEADLADLPALGALAGADLSVPPRGLGAQQLAVTGQLTMDGSGAAFLRGAQIRADGNLIEGDLDLAPGKDRPKISGNLRAQTLDLSGLSGGEGGGAGGGMKAEGWPADPIDVSALSLADAAITLATGALDLGVARFGPVRSLVTIDRARAVFDLREVQAYGGAITGEFVINGRGGLSVGGKLSLAGLQTEPLLMDLAGWDRLVAQGNLTLRFLGVGNSIAAIMQSLEGEGSFSLGQGELKGLDIAGMLRRLDLSYVGEGQKTIFDGISASFTLKSGVLSNADLKLLAPYLTATGVGDLDIGKRRIAYRLRPTALQGEDGSGGVMVPLLISGPWAKPNFALDLETIAREKMEAEARAAEERLRAEAAKAEAEAKARLEEELAKQGIVAKEGESLEEAAKRRAQEVLDEQALKLLQGLIKN
ncbi:AsmA family protein [Xinfangfangia pollutisoli]|uniref:AsmA family protein n=1 Tax=Xinfangfangia pollutisoli TaxID=2865960 RepID=UPI001CD51E9F|nr:AsmA family protein [Xinfangfangia pollutisoli]